MRVWVRSTFGLPIGVTVGVLFNVEWSATVRLPHWYLADVDHKQTCATNSSTVLQVQKKFTSNANVSLFTSGMHIIALRNLVNCPHLKYCKSFYGGDTAWVAFGKKWLAFRALKALNTSWAEDTSHRSQQPPNFTLMGTQACNFSCYPTDFGRCASLFMITCTCMQWRFFFVWGNWVSQEIAPQPPIKDEYLTSGVCSALCENFHVVRFSVVSHVGSEFWRKIRKRLSALSRGNSPWKCGHFSSRILATYFAEQTQVRGLGAQAKQQVTRNWISPAIAARLDTRPSQLFPENHTIFWWG